MAKVGMEQMVERLSEKLGTSKPETEKVVKGFLAEVVSILEEGDSFTAVGYGSFKRKLRQARVASNPRNRELKINIPARYAAVFQVGKGLKDKMDSIEVKEEEAK